MAGAIHSIRIHIRLKVIPQLTQKHKSSRLRKAKTTKPNRTGNNLQRKTVSTRHGPLFSYWTYTSMQKGKQDENKEEYFSRVYFCNKNGHICILISLSSCWKNITRFLKDVSELASWYWKRSGPVEQLFTTIIQPALFYSECV